MDQNSKNKGKSTINKIDTFDEILVEEITDVNGNKNDKFISDDIEVIDIGDLFLQ